MRATCAMVLTAGILTGTTGCATEDVQRFRSDASELRHRLASDAEYWEQALAELEQDHPLRAHAEANLARARVAESAAETAVRVADAAETDPISSIVGWAMPWVPEPARTPLVLGGALAASLIRARKLKTGLRSVARGLDKAMETDPEFQAGFRRHADLFRATQTPTAKRVVDESKGKRFALPV